MSGPVDVIAVMRGMADPNNSSHSESIASVAELIEANDAEYAAIKAYLRGEITQDEHKRATLRRRIALARVKGESA